MHVAASASLEACVIRTSTSTNASSSTAAHSRTAHSTRRSLATAEAKAHFTHEDLVARGAPADRCLALARRHEHACVCRGGPLPSDCAVSRRGIALQSEFAGRCNVQLVAFAQDPLFYPDAAKQQHMHQLMRQAASRNEVGVVGSAPYVESPRGRSSAAQDATMQEHRPCLCAGRGARKACRLSPRLRPGPAGLSSRGQGSYVAVRPHALARSQLGCAWPGETRGRSDTVPS
ncbi:hypothetical protein L1887_49677 [Cichorium endivia]|nr:hypothetical protein L1887_49677 [Cichorium endivia]